MIHHDGKKPPRQVFSLDVLTTSRIQGWVYDPESTETPQRVLIYLAAMAGWLGIYAFVFQNHSWFVAILIEMEWIFASPVMQPRGCIRMLSWMSILTIINHLHYSISTNLFEYFTTDTPSRSIRKPT